MLPQRAILLVRISDDREGEGLGVGRQEADGRAHAERIGWKIAEVIVENDTSAFKRRKVRLPDGTYALRVLRPGFRRGLDLLVSGERDGLLAYDLDRAARDPRDLEDLIDIAEQRKVPVTSVTGSLRLANDADITMARVMVAVANKSSRDTSRRVARKHQQLAEQGKPGGGGRRAVGYEPDGLTVREDEAQAIREIVAIIMDPDAKWSLTSLAQYLDENAPPPPYAASWSARTVASVLRGPRIAGLRKYHGEVVGDATWPAIIPRETWEAIQPKLRDRRGSGDNELKRWLTGVLHCGLCDRPLIGAFGKPRPRYWCATPKGGCGRITITAELVENEVERQILDYISRPENLSNLRSTYSPGSVTGARQQLAEDEQQLKDLAAMWANKDISYAEYAEARVIIADRIKASKALVTSSLPTVVRALMGRDVAAAWQGMSPYARRDVVLALVPGFRVMPAARSRRVFEPDRIVPMV